MKKFMFAVLIHFFSAIALGQAWDVSVTSEKSGHIDNEELIANYLKEYHESELRRKCHSGIGSLQNVDHKVSSEPRGQQILVKIESSGLCVPDVHTQNLIFDACGLSGDFRDRIRNCSSINGAQATVEGEGFKWSLVVATLSGEMIWLDHLEGILWTSPLEGTYMAGVGFNPCKKFGRRYGLEDIALSVPALNHFETAWHHAAQEILAFGRNWYWTSTFRGDIQAYAFNGFNGRGSLASVDRDFRVRCVAMLE
jgi:hypothetical protein